MLRLGLSVEKRGIKGFEPKGKTRKKEKKTGFTSKKKQDLFQPLPGGRKAFAAKALKKPAGGGRRMEPS